MIRPHTNTDDDRPSLDDALSERESLSDGSRIFLWIFSACMIVTAGTAFIFKLIDFFYTATTAGSAALGSFLIPVLNYLIVAAGFLCLFLWAYFSGQFRDIEGPKYRMLEMQREIDEREAI